MWVFLQVRSLFGAERLLLPDGSPRHLYQRIDGADRTRDDDVQRGHANAAGAKRKEMEAMARGAGVGEGMRGAGGVGLSQYELD